MMGNLIAWMYNVTEIPIVPISVMKKEDAVKLFDSQKNSYRNLNFIYEKCNQFDVISSFYSQDISR